MKKGNIAVIGVGTLGMRHLQSLMDISEQYNLYGMDVNTENLKRFEDSFGDTAKLVNSIHDLPDTLDACVIATGANARFKVLKDLLEHSRVDELLLEKILFQKEEEYWEAKQLLNRNKTQVWVNCVRREWAPYKRLKELFKETDSFVYTVNGGEWGLCCNGIHMLDLMMFLADEEDFTINNTLIESIIKESKRKGFYELYGSITGKCGKCRSYQISCTENNTSPSLVMLNADNINVMIDEVKHVMYYAKPDDGWEWHKDIFGVPYQSQLTARIITSMMNNECNLPSFDTSMKSHLKYIRSLQECFLRNGWEDKNICPIT